MKSLTGWTSAYTESSSRLSRAIGSRVRIARLTLRLPSSDATGGNCACAEAHTISTRPTQTARGDLTAVPALWLIEPLLSQHRALALLTLYITPVYYVFIAV